MGPVSTGRLVLIPPLLQLLPTLHLLSSLWQYLSLINHSLHIIIIKKTSFCFELLGPLWKKSSSCMSTRVREKEFTWETERWKRESACVCVCVLSFSALICLAIIRFRPRSSVQLSWLPMKQGDRQKGASCGVRGCDESSRLHCHCAVQLM